MTEQGIDKLYREEKQKYESKANSKNFIGLLAIIISVFFPPLLILSVIAIIYIIFFMPEDTTYTTSLGETSRKRELRSIYNVDDNNYDTFHIENNQSKLCDTKITSSNQDNSKDSIFGFGKKQEELSIGKNNNIVTSSSKKNKKKVPQKQNQNEMANWIDWYDEYVIEMELINNERGPRNKIPIQMKRALKDIYHEKGNPRAYARSMTRNS